MEGFQNNLAQLFALTLHHRIPTVNNPEGKAFENIVGKGENTSNEHFLLFPPQCFLTS